MAECGNNPTAKRCSWALAFREKTQTVELEMLFLRQINASAVDFPANNSTAGYLSMILGASIPFGIYKSIF